MGDLIRLRLRRALPRGGVCVGCGRCASLQSTALLRLRLTRVEGQEFKGGTGKAKAQTHALEGQEFKGGAGKAKAHTLSRGKRLGVALMRPWLARV